MAKTGHARVGFVGFPSVGKSTLLSNLAGVCVESRVACFTLECGGDSDVHPFRSVGWLARTPFDDGGACAVELALHERTFL